MSKRTDRHAQWAAVRCYRLRQAGHTLGEIASITNVSRDLVQTRIKLGERLAVLPEFQTGRQS